MVRHLKEGLLLPMKPGRRRTTVEPVTEATLGTDVARGGTEKFIELRCAGSVGAIVSLYGENSPCSTIVGSIPGL